MKRLYIYLAIVVVIIVGLNVLLFYQSYLRQISYQRNILFQQAENAGDEIESVVSAFESDINKILFYDDIAEIFSSSDIKEIGMRNLKVFYSTYTDLIKNIYIYDRNKNVLNLFKDKKGDFIVDHYVAQRQAVLEERDIIRIKNNNYQFFLPVFKGDKVYGNIIVAVDFTRYMNSVLNKYYLENVLWQSIVDSAGNILSTNIGPEVEFTGINIITANLKKEVKDYIRHTAYVDNKKEVLISVYYPVIILKQSFSLVFSLNNSIIHDYILGKMFLSAGLSLFILFSSLFILLQIIRRKTRSGHEVSSELKRLELIIDNLPIGLLILDSDRKVKTINKTAKELLLLKDNENVIGKNVSDRFLLSKNYYSDEDNVSAYDSNQFILYQKEGNEVVVYKKEVPFPLDDKIVFLEAFIDITSVEKSRKYAVAANTAKSEFLASMSHEIRTPMNGIIGMTDALDQQNLSPAQKEYVEIVKKSADLLLNIIDDILDFSKIESGKMQLEEIPFKLREETKLSLDLFRPIINEKKLKLSVNINPDIPENIIGDPFRLRQVLSNLISNAVKFTHEGEIAVGVKLEEEYSGNMTLLFYVEDTGVGIPEKKIESIFSSFTQADDSTPRKYGGTGLGTTISKQLVNLMHGEIWVESPSSISKSKKYPGSKFSFTIEVFSNEKLDKNLNFDNITEFSQVEALVLTGNIEGKVRLAYFFKQIGIKYEGFKFQIDKIKDLNNKLKEKGKDLKLIFIMDEPNYKGFEIAHKLKEKSITDSYIVFIISSNHKPDNYILAKREGADYYLIQPFEHEDLLNYLHDTFPNVKITAEEETRRLRTDLSILVAEDNIINQKVAETIFNNLGLKIEIANDGKETVEKFNSKKYDIIFMDLVMPNKDGIQATVDIRGTGSQIPIIAMTATASKQTQAQAIASGMNDYIIKPVKLETVRNILLKWFA
jgi:signal transduction histidine kinase/CheY-like chemotaxis protein